MASPPPGPTRAEAILTELTTLGLELARDLQARALEAEDNADAEKLGRAFHAIARSIRQTLALQARLERETRLADHELRVRIAGDHARRVGSRRQEMSAAIRPLIWNEYEGHEREAMLNALDGLIADESLDEDFTQLPLAIVVERFRKILELGEHRSDDDDEDGDDVATDESDEAPLRRSSA